MFSIRIPFQLSHGRRLQLTTDCHFELRQHRCEISDENHHYVLTILGFDSERAASDFLPQACAGLIWYGLKSAIGLKFDAKPASIHYFPAPIPIAEGSSLAGFAKARGWSEVDGEFDADKTVIRPDDMRLIRTQMEAVGLRIESPVSMLAVAMQEGLSAPCPERIMVNPKLKLACEVYLSSHFESTSAATFLSRVTTLEILADDTSVAKPVLKMIERFKADAKVARRAEDDQDIQKDYDPLISRLSELQRGSIGRRIRELVRVSLQGDPEIVDIEKIATEVAALYSVRSDLVHTGIGNAKVLQDGANRLNEIVPRILRSRFRQAATDVAREGQGK